MMLWKRYILREFGKVFFLVLFCIFFLFSVIDYSMHVKGLSNAGFVNCLLYYFFQFLSQAEILLSVALLIATVKVLTTLNVRRELISLLTGGISKRSLSLPLLIIALLSMLLLYANFEWLEPIAIPRISTFEKTYLNKEQQSKTHASRLYDGSLAVYNHYDFETKCLQDLYWIKDNDHIYHMQTFNPHECIGTGVDYLERTTGLHRTKQYETHPFPNMQFDPDSFLPKSLTKLIRNRKWDVDLFYKLTIPFIALLAVMAPLPFCLSFSRQTPTYMIYALSLFGLIAYFITINAAVILGESQTLPAAQTMLTPLAITLLFVSYHYKKMC